MATTTLRHGDKTMLERPDGKMPDRFCVVCRWGDIVRRTGFLGLKKRTVDTDLDLSCAIYDGAGRMIDYIYSPLFRPEFLSRYGMLPGKVDSADKALHHIGEILEWTEAQQLNREIVTVDLTKLDPRVKKIFFLLNNCATEDFAEIPETVLSIHEGDPGDLGDALVEFAVHGDPSHSGKTSLIMARLEKEAGGLWSLTAIGDVTPDKNICETIQRITSGYLK